MHGQGTWARVDDVEVKTAVETSPSRWKTKNIPKPLLNLQAPINVSASLIANIMSGECSDSGQTGISPRQSSFRKRLSPSLQIWLQSPYQDASERVRLRDSGMLCWDRDRAG